MQLAVSKPPTYCCSASHISRSSLLPYVPDILLHLRVREVAGVLWNMPTLIQCMVALILLVLHPQVV